VQGIAGGLEGLHFSGASSSFSAVLAGNEREALLAVVDRLGIELGYAEGGQVPDAHSPLGGEEGAMAGILNSEDELLVARARRGLARIAAALDGEAPEGASGNAVSAALDGAEMVIRGELVSGNADRLPSLIPSFVFLVALPLVDQDRALELSQRAGQLVEGTLKA
jgi:hypothetical protein